MKVLYSHNQFDLYKLTTAHIETYGKDICKSLDQIKLVDVHTTEQLRALQKGDRKLHHKFDHSLIALSGNNYAGIIIGYEREAEENEQYPKNTIYLNDLAVSTDFQKKGLGRFLVEAWLTYNKEVGFLSLDSDLFFSVQTNSAQWNKHVQDLYTSFGFKKIAQKTYDNRVDNVYLLST